MRAGHFKTIPSQEIGEVMTLVGAFPPQMLSLNTNDHRNLLCKGVKYDLQLYQI